MQEIDFKALLKNESFIRYCLKNNPEDVVRWENWIKDHPEHRAQLEELKQWVITLGLQAGKFEVEQGYQRLQTRITQRQHPSRGRTAAVLLSPWLRYAALVVVLVSAGIVLYNKRAASSEQALIPNLVSDISPGDNKATLTLADGSTISLTDAAPGTLDIAAAGVIATKTSAGQLVYTTTTSERQPAETARHTIATPRGGQFQVTLPDGSTAWLNAASSLSYPVEFAKHERRVEMTGEVYFEIAKDKHRPFLVKTDDQTVTVLGTHFNINAYADEPVTRTTLLEGSIKIISHKANTSIVLQPGQRAEMRDHIRIDTADVQETVAWKNGDFMFNDESLSAILRKVSRWYDVDVVYPAGMQELRFTGMVSRSRNISAVLNMIESTGKAHFKLEERRIIVME